MRIIEKSKKDIQSGDVVKYKNYDVLYCVIEVDSLYYLTLIRNFGAVNKFAPLKISREDLDRDYSRVDLAREFSKDFESSKKFGEFKLGDVIRDRDKSGCLYLVCSFFGGSYRIISLKTGAT